MTQITIDKLNKINQDFYFRISKYWNNKDDSAWYGWNTLLPIIQEKFKDKKEISVLDLGCGNARFATFLQSNFLNTKINYIGIDTDPQFLLNGKERNKDDFSSFQLIKNDLIKDDWTTVIQNSFQNTPVKESQNSAAEKNSKFDLVVLFGILHHIPSLISRQHLLNQTSDLLEPNGMSVFTGWRFLDKERLRKRVIDPKQPFYHHALNFFGIKQSELEENDYLLDWVKYEYSIRYAHYISFTEAENIAKLANLEIKTYFIDDSLQRDQNNYWICEKVNNKLLVNPKTIHFQIPK
jgi:tRNA (uracil-5-)-methyltransferase TRM9